MGIYDYVDIGNDTKLGSAAAMLETMRDKKEVYLILYAKGDKREAEQLCDIIENDLELKCWMSPRDIPPNMDYHSAMGTAMSACLVYLIVYSPITTHNNASGGIKEELLAMSTLTDHYNFHMVAVPTSHQINKNDLNGLLEETGRTSKKSIIWSEIPINDPSFKTEGKKKLFTTLAASAIAMFVEDSIKKDTGNWTTDVRPKKKPWWKVWG